MEASRSTYNIMYVQSSNLSTYCSVLDLTALFDSLVFLSYYKIVCARMFQLAFIVLSSVVALSLGAVINKEVTRSVDASTSVVRVTTNIKAAGIDGEYQIAFPNNLAEHLAYVSVTSKGNALVISAPVMNGDYTIYSVAVSDSSATLKVSSVFTSILEPFPAEIKQKEPQYMRLKDSHYFYSPYHTETQKTTFKLASTSIESFTKLAPFTTKGTTVQYGPYENIAPFSVSPTVLHYLNHFPFAKFSTMAREVEVSHWGSIAVEEAYELQHAGAELAGGFSRIDYQMMRMTPGATPSFRKLMTTLPSQASGIYYRDQIGNISTSSVRTLSSGEVELELETRFPIFGGWKTQFYLGYAIPTENALTISGDRYNLKVDFFTGFDDVWVEDMELKVVLPEGCEDITVDAPYVVEQSRTKRYTYLDSEFNGGRPVLVLRGKNLVPEHDKQVRISYTFVQKRMVVEPMMLVATFFAFFLVSSVLARTGAAVKGLKKQHSTSDATKEAASQ